MFVFQPAELGGESPFLTCLALACPGLGLWEKVVPALMSAARDSTEVRKCRWSDGAWDFQINPGLLSTAVPRG